MPADSELRKSIGVQLEGILHDAEKSYSYLRKKHGDRTKMEIILVGVLVWIGSFVALGLSSIVLFGQPANRPMFGLSYSTVLEVFLASIVISIASGLSTYLIRRRRGFPFAELGTLIAKMKEVEITSEDGLKLIDATQQAMLAAKKGKVDSAFTYGVVAFILVGLFGLNAAIGLLAGVVVYLYFRFEAIREYEREEMRHEQSKSALLQSL